jgi:DNA-binding transcriptional regulator YiaG
VDVEQTLDAHVAAAVLPVEARRSLLTLRRRGLLRQSLPEPPRCREIREAAGVTVEELAGVLRCSRFTLMNWEAGRRSASPRFRERYSEALALLASDEEPS